MASEIHLKPDYKRIYTDIVKQKQPTKYPLVKDILTKQSITNHDVLTLNKILFSKKGEDSNFKQSQKHKAYSKETILEILRFQKDNQLNNSDISRKYKISRNSVAKWKKNFFDEL